MGAGGGGGLHRVEAVFDAVDNISGMLDRVSIGMSALIGSTGQALSGMGAGFEDFGAALMAFSTGPIGFLQFGLGTIVPMMTEMSDSMAGISARTGLAGDALNAFKTDATALFSTALVGSFDEAARLIEKIRVDIGLADEAAVDLAINAAGVGKGFSTSADKILDTVDEMISKFDDLTDAALALDLITTIAQKSHEPMSHVLSLIGKFSDQLNAAGVSALGMGGLIVIAAELGIGDKGIGALVKGIVTFHDKVAKPPPEFLKAMDMLGLGSVVKDLQENKITMETAFDLVIRKLGEVETVEGLVGTGATGIDKAQIMMTLFGKAATDSLGPDVLAKFADFQNKLGGEAGIKGAAATAASAVQDTFGGAVSRTWNTITSTVTTKVDEIFRTLSSYNWAKGWEDLKGAAEKLWNDIKTGIEKIWGDIVKGVQKGWDDLTKGVQGAFNDVKNAFDRIGKAMSDALGPIVKVIQGILDGIAKIAGAGGGNTTSGLGPNWGMPGHAAGGDLGEGWSAVGDEGPELAYKRGGTTTIFSNRDSRAILGSGAGAGGGNTYISVGGGNYMVGSSGMEEFVRKLYVKFQREQERRPAS